jgi:hypothetical protein
MATKKEIISSKAVETLANNPDGIRYSELVRKMHLEFPDIPINTIYGVVWDLDLRIPDKVYKASRGLFRHTNFRAVDISEAVPEVTTTTERIEEENFYVPFSNWLVNDLEECTKAIVLGGNKFKDKWGTPDVIGKREPSRSDIIKGDTEIVSAEVKINTKELITAFGQACSYKLFSHKSYIVVPKNSPQDDIARLDSLCLIFGIGLILFDSNDATNPQFEIRVRAMKHEPDMFYANKYMSLIEKDLF